MPGCHTVPTVSPTILFNPVPFPIKNKMHVIRNPVQDSISNLSNSPITIKPCFYQAGQFSSHLFMFPWSKPGNGTKLNHAVTFLYPSDIEPRRVGQ